MRNPWPITALLITALTTPSACSSDDADPSLTVVVDTNYGARLEAAVAAVLDPEGDATVIEHRFEADDHPFPLSFGVVPVSGEPSLTISVTAIGASGALSSRIARTSVEGEDALALPIFLDAACEQTTCPSNETCTEAGCESIDVVAYVTEPGQELDGLCRPGESWCDEDGTTLVECPRFGAPPTRTACADGCQPGASECDEDTSSDRATVTVSVGTNGRVVSAPAGILCGSECSATFATGTTVWLQALPDIGYEVDAWSASCVTSLSEPDRCALVLSDDASADVTFQAVTAQPELRVNVTGTGPARVFSVPAGISCLVGDVCRATFPRDSTVELFVETRPNSTDGAAHARATRRAES